MLLIFPMAFLDIELRNLEIALPKITLYHACNLAITLSNVNFCTKIEKTRIVENTGYRQAQYVRNQYKPDIDVAKGGYKGH